MTVGVAYNVFDGEELLVPSVRRIRAFADKIVICFSEKSNTGEINQDLGFTLERLRKMVDLLVPFTPHLGFPAHDNEVAKRNLGLQYCADCDVFMSMDCDEFYDIRQLRGALDRFVSGDFDSTACQMQTYYKYADIRFVPPEDYYVPLFYRNNGRQFEFGIRWPVLVDPTRRMPPGEMLLFSRSEIEMHHMSHVRRDIRRKLRNSSQRVNFADRMETIAVWHDRWTEGQLALLPAAEDKFTVTQRVALPFPELARFRSPPHGEASRG